MATYFNYSAEEPLAMSWRYLPKIATTHMVFPLQEDGTPAPGAIPQEKKLEGEEGVGLFMVDKNRETSGANQVFPFVAMAAGICHVTTGAELRKLSLAAQRVAPGCHQTAILLCVKCNGPPRLDGTTYVMLVQCMPAQTPTGMTLAMVPRLMCMSCFVTASQSGASSCACAQTFAEGTAQACAQTRGAMPSPLRLWDEMVMVGTVESCKFAMGKMLGSEGGFIQAKVDPNVKVEMEFAAGAPVRKCGSGGCGKLCILVEGHVVGEAFKRCSGCHTVWYCGRDCQLAHWQTHKAVCKRLKEMVAAGNE